MRKKGTNKRENKKIEDTKQPKERRAKEGKRKIAKNREGRVCHWIIGCVRKEKTTNKWKMY